MMNCYDEEKNYVGGLQLLGMCGRVTHWGKDLA